MEKWNCADEEELCETLLDHASTDQRDNLHRSFAHLDDLFIAAHLGRWHLSPAATVDSQEVIRALNTARHPRPHDVRTAFPVPISWLNQRLPRQSWMTETEYRRAAVDQTVGRWNSVSRSLGERMWRPRDPLNDPHDAEFERNLSPIDKELGLFNGSLWRSLERTFWGCIPPVCRNGHLGHLYGYVRATALESVLLFLYAAVHGNTPVLDMMIPLFRLMPDCLPLGSLKDDPKTWLYLCA